MITAGFSGVTIAQTYRLQWQYRQSCSAEPKDLPRKLQPDSFKASERGSTTQKKRLCCHAIPRATGAIRLLRAKNLCTGNPTEMKPDLRRSPTKFNLRLEKEKEREKERITTLANAENTPVSREIANPLARPRSRCSLADESLPCLSPWNNAQSIAHLISTGHCS